MQLGTRLERTVHSFSWTTLGASALCGEPNCPGQRWDCSVGLHGQGHVASCIWSLQDLMRKPTLEKERPGCLALQISLSRGRGMGQWP